MRYTEGGLMTEFRDRRGLVNRFEYDEHGRLTRDIDAGGGWRIERSELTRGYRTTMTTGEGRTLNFTVEPQVNGDRVYRKTTPDGAVREERWTAAGERLINEADGTLVSRRMGPDPRFGLQSPVPVETEIVTPGGLRYMAKGERKLGPIDPFGAGQSRPIRETIEINGRARHTDYDPATRTYTRTSAAGRVTREVINDRHRSVRVQIEGLAAVDFGYDDRGRMIEARQGEGTDLRVTRFVYYESGSQAGYLKSVIDSSGRGVTFEYDPVGRVTRQTLPDDRVIDYAYDASGNLVSITPPGRPAHVFNYNAFDLEASYTPPAVPGVSDPRTVYDYNLDKQIERITRPDGRTIDYRYHPETGQLEAVQTPSGSYAYSYVQGTGQLHRIISPDSIELTYGYDGFLITEIDWAGLIAGKVNVAYDEDFRVRERCVNTTSCVTFAYDDDKLPISAGALRLTRAPQRGGLITGASLNGVASEYRYNAFGELEGFQAEAGGTPLYSVSYQRDALGRITRKVETVLGAEAVEEYAYDEAGRLVGVVRDGSTIAYAYDDNGNRLSRTEVDSRGVVTSAETGRYDDQDRMIAYGDCAYEYTDNGELRAKICGDRVTRYDYDVFGNLRSVVFDPPRPGADGAAGGAIEYLIDGRNRRVGKRVDGTLVQAFLYKDQLNPIAELNADGTIRSRFVYAENVNVPSYMI
ncbi:MAG: hypothetical protein KatS3mg121_0264 [Gammaproteobacteria bacterium]|nr:MAG: hypothetical protein KatS3mg121_0264 [Gammaproteobacteria bacterium]